MKIKTLNDMGAEHCHNCDYHSCADDNISKQHLREEAKKWYDYYNDEENSFPLVARTQVKSFIEQFFNLEDEDDRKDIQQRSN